MRRELPDVIAARVLQHRAPRLEPLARSERHAEQCRLIHYDTHPLDEAVIEAHMWVVPH